MAKPDGKAKQAKGKNATYMCAVCGHIAIGKIPIKCPECGAGGDNFQKIA